MSQSEKSFTVSDRRHFTPEGRPRDEASQDEASQDEATQEAGVAEPHVAGARPSGAAAASGAAEERPADFSHFLLGLAAQAGQLISGQGLPEGTTPQEALAGARGVIAILEMLKGKTEGRRTSEEDALVSQLLFELRMAYVERTRAGKP